jgi:Kdo2-lipid IVA lauroyltransferase/acyltransferase
MTKSAWWLRAAASLPFPVLYALAGLIAFLAHRVFKHRAHVVQENLTKAFPERSSHERAKITRDFYRGFAQIGVELIKSANLSAAQIRRRVRIVNLELPHGELAQGRSVLLMAAHQCNWEWQLQALALNLQYPYFVSYKPLVNAWLDHEMFTLRTRFGAQLATAQTLLPDLLKNQNGNRAVSMAVDQEPGKTERRHWVQFLNRPTAFYLGAERIARSTGHPVFFVAMRRTARGRYELEFVPLMRADETLPPGELTERYARAVEQQIHAAPADWPWTHKRWRQTPPENTIKC